MDASRASNPYGKPVKRAYQEQIEKTLKKNIPASSTRGNHIIPKNSISPHEYLFGEDQSRYLVEVNKKNKNEVTEILEKNAVFYEVIATTQKDSLELDKEFNIKLDDLSKLNSYWFNNFFKEI